MTVEGGTEAERKTFYTAVYHNLLHPNIYNDVNGAYMGFDDKVHQVEPGRKQYANFSLWDTYRTSSFLQALLAPKESSDMIQSLLHDAEQGGAYPNWSMNNVEYGVMNGYSTFPFIAAMYAMGARDFDLQASKDMMKKVSTSYLKCKGYQGWVCLDDYMRYGYVPVDRHGHGASMTLEYCIDDFSIAQICKAAGDSSAYSYYMDRAQNFENIFDKETRLFRPRKQDGSFLSPFTKQGPTAITRGMRYSTSGASPTTWMPSSAWQAVGNSLKTVLMPLPLKSTVAGHPTSLITGWAMNRVSEVHSSTTILASRGSRRFW